MKVYVVTQGCYSNLYVSGVYSTPEAAIRDNPPRARVPEDYVPTAANLSRPGGWVKRESEQPDGSIVCSWHNGLDWDDSANIEEYDLVE